MPESLLPRAATTLKGAQKFLGVGVFGGLERRVANNEKKITSLKNILKISRTGINRISIGSLTHSPKSFDSTLLI